jgi:hypothetical protein
LADPKTIVLDLDRKKWPVQVIRDDFGAPLGEEPIADMTEMRSLREA